MNAIASDCVHHFIYIDCSIGVARDVVFVIDTSYSSGSYRFQLVRQLTENITTALKVTSPETLFGLITFDSYARFEFNISRHTDLSTLLPAINPGLPYPYYSYSSNKASALNLLLSGAGEGGFLQLRNGTSKVAIMITYGYSSSYYSSILLAANSLHAANIFDVYVVGIGNNYYSELLSIASDPSFVFTTSSLSSFTAQQLEYDLIEELCNGTYVT